MAERDIMEQLGYIRGKVENIEKNQKDMWDKINPLCTEVTILKTKAGFISGIIGATMGGIMGFFVATIKSIFIHK